MSGLSSRSRPPPKAALVSAATPAPAAAAFEGNKGCRGCVAWAGTHWLASLTPPPPRLRVSSVPAATSGPNAGAKRSRNDANIIITDPPLVKHLQALGAASASVGCAMAPPAAAQAGTRVFPASGGKEPLALSFHPGCFEGLSDGGGGSGGSSRGRGVSRGDGAGGCGVLRGDASSGGDASGLGKPPDPSGKASAYSAAS